MTHVLQWLEHTAARLPNKVAVADPAASYTFCQLQAAARSAASVFAHLAPRRSAIAFYMDKEVRAVAGFYGAAWAGCFYVMLDPTHPPARTQLILDTLKPACIVTTQERRAAAEALGAAGPVLDIDEVLSSPTEEALLAERRQQALDTDPLYANFTSGSTGVPKGVLVCHRSVIDFIGVFTKLFSITENDVFGNQAPLDFDVSVKDLYSGLATGARVELLPKAYFSFPTKLMDHLADRGVTTLVWAVSALVLVSTMQGLEYRLPAAVNKILFSGELMPVKHLNHWRAFLPNALYVNLYGPTEITCNCTYHVVEGEFADEAILPAGKAFPNEWVFLLDEQNEEVTTPGQLGEICVSGTALALGYFNDQGRTAAAFCHNPLTKGWSELMYRTGDLGRWGEDGLLYFVSRKDFQIKHMGHRIELGEIESAAGALPQVERACCVFLPDKGRLCLYYEGEAREKEVLAALRQKLPVFMLPQALRHKGRLPLNQNGKIDRQLLLAEEKELQNTGER